MEVPKVDKIQLTQEREKEVRKTLELVLIQEHSKGKVRYVFNDDTEITTHVTIAAHRDISFNRAIKHLRMCARCNSTQDGVLSGCQNQIVAQGL